MGFSSLCTVLLTLVWGQGASDERQIAEAIDKYLDDRWEYSGSATSDLSAKIRAAGLDVRGVERLLRRGRYSVQAPPEQRGRLTYLVPLTCDHVDYSTVYYVYVPTSYDLSKPHPLLVVGHGGSAERDRAFGASAAMAGLLPWLETAENTGLLVAAPITERGWGAIGYSILFSLISKIQRAYNVDPDRVYLTGHSMGGHLTYRSGIYAPDRWGAISPMSGGYDYVASKEVLTLFNVPGYATYGTKEPYDINAFNSKMKAWMGDHRYPWQFAEKAGGHEIFHDEIPKVAQFFLEHPRDLYRAQVYARGSGRMQYDTADPKAPKWDRTNTWKKDRPISTSTFHWVRLMPLHSDIPKERSVQEAWAVNKGDNSIEILSRNVRELRLYLHDRMVDFSKPVRVRVNGEVLLDKTVKKDLGLLLELAREFDDRGRVFHAAIDLKIQSDGEMPEPRGK